MCNVQVAVGVEAVHEFGTLITQVAFERKIQIERRAVGDCVVAAFLVLSALELLFHAHSAEIGNVGEFAGVRKADIGVGGFVVVATVEVRVLSNHVAGDDFCEKQICEKLLNYFNGKRPYLADYAIDGGDFPRPGRNATPGVIAMNAAATQVLPTDDPRIKPFVKDSITVSMLLAWQAVR